MISLAVWRKVDEAKAAMARAEPGEMKAALQDYKRLLRKHGICRKCGKMEVIPGASECPHCRRKEKERKRERIRKLVEAGICIRCGKEKAREGKRTCQACGEILAARQRKINRIRKEKGLCRWCGKPVEDGRALCQECSEKSLAYCARRSMARYEE